ncbi:hypothetical protein D3C75_1182690 [compost metagenome]|uniref:Uncharacterized protein n=1 Tax=Paenibacillus jilunlii TaxID=682956 RepID=A0A1G9GQ60_9BACL|nr:hypothetical protein [Paenibacillus jilunlii]KWX73873.1 hypothetical protein AML91_16570 [Paenibacillus jilunlii]SDL02806.1 hypothetical protein SAMN05216191_101515 [Paenibacillus jilunlii]
MVSQPGLFYGGGISVFFFLIWLACIGLGVFAFILFVKLALRAITALDLYNHAKNLEIRERYESVKKDDNV